MWAANPRRPIGEELILMLAITADAAIAIRTIIDESPLPAESGLRLSPASGQEGDVELALSEAPEEADEVVVDQGVQIFLAPPLAERLDDQLLDARLEQGGRVAFELLPQ
jgi:iron-sulfur cluster assembly protein